MRYDAFISYRHSELDMFVAKKIHKGLETLKVPRSVRKISDKKKIQRVFRDQEELPIGSDLTNNIETALQESEYLLVICSPRTVQSEWVHKEVNTFIKMHGREHILAILIEGEPYESIPPQLLVDEEGNHVEPLAADVRGKDKREVNKKLKTEILRLAAPLLHCSYDDLKQRHRERRLKKIISLTSVAAALAVAFGAYSVYKTSLIQKNYEEKQKNQSRYLADTSLRLSEEGDLELAALVALEALPSNDNDRPFVPYAQYALSQAIRAYDVNYYIGKDRVLKSDFPISDFHYNQDGTRLVAHDTGNSVTVWDMETYECLAKIGTQLGNIEGFVKIVRDARIIGDNVLVCSNDDMVMYDMSGQELWKTDEGWSYYTFNKAETIVACVGAKEILFYETETGKELYTIKNESDNSFTSNSCFFGDDSKFLVSHLIGSQNNEDEDTTGEVSVIDLKSKNIVSCKTKKSTISSLSFTSDGNVVVVSQYISFTFNEDEKDHIYIEKFDSNSGEALWEYRFDVIQSTSNDTLSKIKCRSITDNAGNTINEAILIRNNNAVNINSDTGEVIKIMQTGSGITEILLRADSEIGFFAEANGNIDIVDMSTGEIYSNNTIETDFPIKGMLLQNGIIVIRGYSEPNLLVLKYKSGKDMKEVVTTDYSVSYFDYSPSEKYYMIRPASKSGKNDFDFFNADDDSLAAEFDIELDGFVKQAAFLDDENYLVVSSYNELYILNIEKSEISHKLELEEGIQNRNTYITYNNKYILISNGNEFYVVDIDAWKLLASYELETDVHSARLTEDGQIIYALNKDSNLLQIDVSTGNITVLTDINSSLSTQSFVGTTMAISQDGRYIVASSRVNMIIIYDTVEGRIINEMPFYGSYEIFLQFSDDSKKLFLQGGEKNLKVYDLETGTFSFISTEKFNDIESARFDYENNRIILVTLNEIVILDGDTYEKIDQIEKGIGYMPNKKLVFCGVYTTLERFPYKSLEMLIEESKDVVGDATLTELQRRQYNVD